MMDWRVRSSAAALEGVGGYEGSVEVDDGELGGVGACLYGFADGEVEQEDIVDGGAAGEWVRRVGKGVLGHELLEESAGAESGFLRESEGVG